MVSLKVNWTLRVHLNSNSFKYVVGIPILRGLSSIYLHMKQTVSVSGTLTTMSKLCKYNNFIVCFNYFIYFLTFFKFSATGIRLALDYFDKRGHKDVVVVIPRHYQGKGGRYFHELEHSGKLTYTPSRTLNRERQTVYDDR
ncbi:unnamed protein product [Trichobilharzia regenti]|nr:unnamed protein product [Trichobilharzia regenti]